MYAMHIRAPGLQQCDGVPVVGGVIHAMQLRGQACTDGIKQYVWVACQAHPICSSRRRQEKTNLSS